MIQNTLDEMIEEGDIEVMKVILLQDVKALGKKGDVVECQ